MVILEALCYNGIKGSNHMYEDLIWNQLKMILQVVN